MKIDANTVAFKLVKYQAKYHVYSVAPNGDTMLIIANNGNPVTVRSVVELRDRLGRMVSKGIIESKYHTLPIGF